jgi:SAM-dependent methyltransferase
MLRRAAIVAPGCSFAVAQAEAIPIRDGSIDLITGAGSLNYVHLDRFFPEARRVLGKDGALLVYDFSAASSFQNGRELDEWFSEFVRRYPWPPNEARELNPEILGAFDSGFEVRGKRFEIGLRMTSAFYVSYMMTETNVAFAVRRGTSPEEVETWLRESLAPVWSGIDREVLFRGYFVWLTRM